GFSRELLEMIDAGLTVLPNDRPQSITAWRSGSYSAPDPTSDATIVRAKGKPRRVAQSPAHRAPPPADWKPPSKAVGFASLFASRRSWALTAGVTAAVLVVLAGGYWAFEATRAPATAVIKDLNPQSGDEVARQKAEAREKAEADARLKAEAEAKQKAEA